MFLIRHVVSTINWPDVFIFSLFWPSSAAFCISIIDIVQKLRTYFFFRARYQSELTRGGMFISRVRKKMSHVCLLPLFVSPKPAFVQRLPEHFTQFYLTPDQNWLFRVGKMSPKFITVFTTKIRTIFSVELDYQVVELVLHFAVAHHTSSPHPPTFIVIDENHQESGLSILF